MIAKTPRPPYYAVIFSSLKKDDTTGYQEMAGKMEKLAKEQPGYLGFESARDGLGISVSYWKDLESIKNWKAHSEHILAQQMGIKSWYSRYKVRIAKVERDYEFSV